MATPLKVSTLSIGNRTGSHHQESRKVSLFFFSIWSLFNTNLCFGEGTNGRLSPYSHYVFLILPFLSRRSFAATVMINSLSRKRAIICDLNALEEFTSSPPFIGQFYFVQFCVWSTEKVYRNCLLDYLFSTIGVLCRISRIVYEVSSQTT